MLLQWIYPGRFPAQWCRCRPVGPVLCGTFCGCVFQTQRPQCKRGTTANITRASLALIQKIKNNPMISVKTPRKNSASVNEMASCICDRSEEIRLLSSPTLFSVKKLMGMVSNLLYTSLRISANDRSPAAVSRYTRIKEKIVCTVSWQKISSRVVFKLQ